MREGKVGKNTGILSWTPRPLVQYELREDNTMLLEYNVKDSDTKPASQSESGMFLSWVST